ncbi:MAG: HlyD family efflux transporter periplasmic adaptor subunit, partial [Muribaculaceae bacterium]|nr:HlyD family efflux transporter periplasmic adaptor subunit [Muribaculaceae bacterium]
KKPWYWRYRYHLLAATAVVVLLIYGIILALNSGTPRVDRENLTIASVKEDRFLEYVDVEGIVQPIMTVKVNALESGFVDRIVAEDGAMLKAGDTILILKNPDLMRTIHDEEDEWRHQQRQYREQEIEMQQKSITLQQQALDANYEMNNLDNKRRIAREEFEMGMKSKAEMDLAESEYDYRRKKTSLQLKSLSHDSAATAIRRELLAGDMDRAQTKRDRAARRSEDLIVRAPVSGQLSFLTVTPGQQVLSGASIGELKVLSDYKLHVSLNEYYVERIVPGLPAKIVLKSESYPLKVSRVVPEIKERSFESDLVFTGDRPSSLRVGKSFRAQIELGMPESAVVIQRGDFYSATNGKWIYKLSKDGSKAIKTEIELGRQNPQQFEVISGLTPGDRVIVSGYDKLNDSDEIILQ